MPGEAGVDLANLRPQVNRVNGVGTPMFSSEPESNLPRCSFRQRAALKSPVKTSPAQQGPHEGRGEECRGGIQAIGAG